MEINLVAHDFAFSPALKGHAERRVQLALAHLRHKVSRIAIRLCDLNGPRGGADKACKVSIVMPGHPEIIVRDVQEDMYFAIDSAVKRAAYRAMRLVTRRRNPERDASPRMIPFRQPEGPDHD